MTDKIKEQIIAIRKILEIVPPEDSSKIDSSKPWDILRKILSAEDDESTIDAAVRMKNELKNLRKKVQASLDKEKSDWRGILNLVEIHLEQIEGKDQ